MQKQVELGESVGLTDLGNAVLKTKQRASMPYCANCTFGYGIRP